MIARLRKPSVFSPGVYELSLTHGHSVLFDECDLERVQRHTWFAHLRNKKPHWYASGYVDGRFTRMHRFILGMDKDDRRQVDHISGNQGDNRRCNLRIVDNRQNNQNRQTATGIVPFKGVSLSPNGLYRVGIHVNGSRLYHGTFTTAIAAANAYDAAALRYFGEFAATNASLGLLESTQ
jgi:hypothetical protein